MSGEESGHFAFTSVSFSTFYVFFESSITVCVFAGSPFLFSSMLFGHKKQFGCLPRGARVRCELDIRDFDFLSFLVAILQREQVIFLNFDVFCL